MMTAVITMMSTMMTAATIMRNIMMTVTIMKRSIMMTAIIMRRNTIMTAAPATMAADIIQADIIKEQTTDAGFYRTSLC